MNDTDKEGPCKVQMSNNYASCAVLFFFFLYKRRNLNFLLKSYTLCHMFVSQGIWKTDVTYFRNIFYVTFYLTNVAYSLQFK